MIEPTAPRANLMRVAIIVLAVAVVAITAFVVFLLWGRDAETDSSSPSQSPSASSVSESSASPSNSGVESTTTPAGSTPSPSTTAASSITVGTTATAGRQATTTTPEAPTAGQTMMWEGMASFEDITVELLQEDEDQSTEMIDGKAGFLVEVCVMKAVDGGAGAQITSASWTLQDSDGNVQSPQRGGYAPPLPADSVVEVGECTNGFLTFDYVSADSDYANLVHDDGLGNRAVWQFH